MLADNCDDLAFDFERHLPQRPPVQKSFDVCQDYQSGHCPHGDQCTRRHVLTRALAVQYEVCKYWLRGSCANGPDCVYMHTYDERFVPECIYFQKHGKCTNPDCNFRHVDPSERIPRCAAYERGFCPRGPECHLRHVKRRACPQYMAGFCPLGPQCTEGHPAIVPHDKYTTALRVRRRLDDELRDQQEFEPTMTCYKCLDPGHIPKRCPGVSYGRLYQSLRKIQEPGEQPIFTAEGRTVGCFICCAEDHTVRECPERDRGVGWQLFGLQPPRDDRRGRPPGGYGGGYGGPPPMGGPPHHHHHGGAPHHHHHGGPPPHGGGYRGGPPPQHQHHSHHHHHHHHQAPPGVHPPVGPGPYGGPPPHMR